MYECDIYMCLIKGDMIYIEKYFTTKFRNNFENSTVIEREKNTKLNVCLFFQNHLIQCFEKGKIPSFGGSVLFTFSVFTLCNLVFNLFL